MVATPMPLDPENPGPSDPPTPAGRGGRPTRAWRAGPESEDDSLRPTLAERDPEDGLDLLEESFDGWDRYDVLGFIAEGGMGRVYKARDRQLGRLVALKFIAGGHRLAVQRFAQEAQAQARVDHPCVCRIYEVGEHRGNPYIALQYIQGRPLSECLGELVLEEKVGLVRDVAEGLHAAHRLGLIHRDVKTGNIMVEQGADGIRRPYIMDFGLARPQGSPNLTQTGLIVGTPAFMSPEQARGDPSRVDRRSDIYALGVTLYEVLTGRLPFQAKSSVDLLVAVLTEDPLPLRQVLPQVPADLESITLKCLEKDPSRRYESAHALAEDLGRFLDGEPVRARQIGFLRRLERRIRRHPVAASVAGISLILAAGLGGWGLLSAWRAREQTVLAQRFGQEVGQLDALLRFAHLLPLHELQTEKALIREGMNRIRADMARQGAPAQGPGRAALGRCLLALQEWAQARSELEAAWKLGTRSPEVAQSLGRTLATLYQQELAEARRIPDSDAKERRKQVLAASLRDPALGFLRMGPGRGGEAALTEGIVALQEERYEDGLRRAREALAQYPWLYEAMLLEGDLWRARASAHFERGESRQALEASERALEAFRQAGTIARSDPQVPLGMARAYHIQLLLRVQQGQPAEDLFKAGMAAIEESRKADPLPESFQLESRLQWQRASDAFYRGGDGRPALQAAIRAGKRAIELDPRQVSHYEIVATACWFLSQQESSRGGDGEPALAEAEQVLKAAAKVDPESTVVQRNLGVVEGIRAELCFRDGRDPLPHLERSAGHFRRAIRSDSRYLQAFKNLGNTLYLTAQALGERGRDPMGAVQEGEEVLEKALALNPRQPEALDELGSLRALAARHRFRGGQDPGGELDRALAYFARALGENPAMPQALVHRAEALLLRAEHLVAEGKPWDAILAEALSSCRKAREIAGDHAEIIASLADLLLFRARLEQASGRSPAAYLREARIVLEAGLKRDPKSPQLWERMAGTWLPLAPAAPRPESDLAAAQRALGKVRTLSAEGPASWILELRLARARAGRRPDPASLRQGHEAAATLLRFDPSHAEARAWQGSLLLLEAKAASGPERARLAGAALRAFSEALAANRFLVRVWAGELDSARAIPGG
ncbi:MAG: protein kinase [Acidobacteria bacterium]|nr:protein kinase [Acidobacteriota bacterium]